MYILYQSCSLAQIFAFGWKETGEPGGNLPNLVTISHVMMYDKYVMFSVSFVLTLRFEKKNYQRKLFLVWSTAYTNTWIRYPEWRAPKSYSWGVYVSRKKSLERAFTVLFYLHKFVLFYWNQVIRFINCDGSQTCLKSGVKNHLYLPETSWLNTE